MANAEEKKAWRWVLVVGLIVELVLINIVGISVWLHGIGSLPIWQVFVFMGIAIWIYIAYLKQRQADISKFVVDEKIKTHALLEQLKEGVILIDQNNCVLVLNPKASELTGVEELDVLGSPVSELFDEDSADKLASGQEGSMHAAVKASGASVRLAVNHLSSESGESNYTMIYLKPEKTAAPEEAPGNAALSRDAVSAELLGVLEGVTDEQLQMKLARVLVMALSDELVACCAGVVEDIRKRTLGEQIDSKEVRVSELLDSIIKPLTDKAPSAFKIDVAVSGAAGEAVMNVSPELMKSALAQVIYNALIDSLPGGSVEVKVAEMGSNVGVAVIDKGPPVSQGDKEALFDLDYRGSTSDEGEAVRVQGTGYFLSRGIIEAHGGTVVAESSGDSGLRVTAMLPCG